MKRRGFSLVELLIVMSLIALLLAVLVPGLAAARRLAERTRCMSNLKRVGEGFKSFYSAFGHWPTRENINYPNEWDTAFYDQMFDSYLTDPKVFYCPSSGQYDQPGDDWKKSWAGTNKAKLSYAILDGKPGPASRWAGGSGWDGAKGLARSKNDLGGSSSFQVSSNNWVSLVDAQPKMMGSAFEFANGPLAGDLIIKKPNGARIANHTYGPGPDPVGMNVLYFDGSVQWLTEEPLSSNTNEQPYQPRWRSIWQHSNGDELRWIWSPRDIELEYSNQ